MWVKSIIIVSTFLLIGCGIDGEPIAPAEKPKKVTIKPKLSQSESNGC